MTTPVSETELTESIEAHLQERKDLRAANWRGL